MKILFLRGRIFLTKDYFVPAKTDCNVKRVGTWQEKLRFALPKKNPISSYEIGSIVVLKILEGIWTCSRTVHIAFHAFVPRGAVETIAFGKV